MLHKMDYQIEYIFNITAARVCRWHILQFLVLLKNTKILIINSAYFVVFFLILFFCGKGLSLQWQVQKRSKALRQIQWQNLLRFYKDKHTCILVTLSLCEAFIMDENCVHCNWNGVCKTESRQCECYQGFKGTDCSVDCGCQGHGVCNQGTRYLRFTYCYFMQ